MFHIDNKENKNQKFYYLIITFFFLIFGIFIGFSQKESIAKIVNKNINNSAIIENNKDGINLAPFWKVWNEIDKKYPDSENTNNEERVFGAIKGLIGSLGDPHSSFFTPEEKKIFEEDISGNFSGVGMEIGIKDGILTVISPLKDTPAYRAGIKPGDKILKIEELVTNELTTEKAITMIRGEKGTDVSLTIFRDGFKEPKVFKITRDIIEIPTLDTEILNENIFVVRLYSFSATSTKLFKESMKEFYDSKLDKLIIDLRGNPGGYLEAAIDISSWFLPKDKVVVIEEFGKEKKVKEYKSYGYDLFKNDIKIVILIDEGSASASEIVAGALRDNDKATLVGQKSYGKGSVQEVVDITPKTMLKITVAKWLTPKGNSISEKGVTPDFEVKLNEDYVKGGKDSQMEKAIEILKK